MTKKLKVLFLCTGNSCRSQMAEGLCRELKREQIEPFSAGTQKHGLNPLAVKAMGEIGVDISGNTSKTFAELEGLEFDYVITVCGHAQETCPYSPALIKVLHQGFDDPPKLALGAATEEEALGHYRRVRDEIRDYILRLPEAFEG